MATVARRWISFTIVRSFSSTFTELSMQMKKEEVEPSNSTIMHLKKETQVAKTAFARFKAGKKAY
ncbi:hypothetical protein N7520_005950 [Penicillium odoratum]|uniref:uncharacterized protein n=1 Tax=Penicillium odoratum TaxID=1167516 RepID=UPI002546D61E|nr:uncharacterized protein N7520_005950 [Penicillium odoratum]KAJ5758794.1 hypothetical protein N7520_005950 [Penicillium odoratum]